MNMSASRLVEPMSSEFEKPAPLPRALKVSRDYSDWEDEQAGPVFVRLPDAIGWVKVNNFSACEQCRTSHVKCSLSETGGPCTHCKNRNQCCKVYGWIFNPEDPPRHIYKPVLPPPPAAPPSPPSSKVEPYEFEWQLLDQKLNWLQREAPRKFRKRSTAMPWKDELNGIPSGGPNHKRRQGRQLQQSDTLDGFQNMEKTSQKVSVPRVPSKRTRLARGKKDLTCEYAPRVEEPVVKSAQHRMSISFILSPCNSEDMMRLDPRNDSSVDSSNGWESTRTSFTSSEAGWSPRSATRSPSLPPADCSLKSKTSEDAMYRSPIVRQQIGKQEILSRFEQWRPPGEPQLLSTNSRMWPG